MNKISFYGWAENMPKISATKLFQMVFKLSLSEGKSFTDRLLEGEIFILEVDEHQDVNFILKRFEEIGVKCCLL